LGISGKGGPEMVVVAVTSRVDDEAVVVVFSVVVRDSFDAIGREVVVIEDVTRFEVLKNDNIA
jgi:hypothetical protein